MFLDYFALAVLLILGTAAAVIWVLLGIMPGRIARDRNHPGQTFSAQVDAVIPMNSMGQALARGVLSDLEDKLAIERPYGVILTLDDAAIDITELPGGAIGTADIFTDRAE